MSLSTRAALDPGFLAALERLQLVARRARVRSGKGEIRSRRSGSSMEFADYRAYTPGDDLRYVDWNVYARLDRIMLKQFTSEDRIQVHLLLDKSASMIELTGKRETALRIAAAFGYLALAGGDRLRLVELHDGLAEGGAAWSGLRQIPALFDRLDQSTFGGPCRLCESCEAWVRSAPVGGLAVVISDFLEPGAGVPGLEALRGRGFDVLAVRVEASEEREPVIRGSVRLRDSESGELRDLNIGASELERYAELRASHRQQLADFAARSGSDVLDVSTDADIVELLLAYQMEGSFLR